MSNGASNDGADNSQRNRPEDSQMSVHDRLGDDARDQPNENIPNEVQHPDSFRCAATLMLVCGKGKSLYPKALASPSGRRQKSVSVESAWSPSTISFSPHEVNLLK